MEYGGKRNEFYSKLHEKGSNFRENSSKSHGEKTAKRDAETHTPCFGLYNRHSTSQYQQKRLLLQPFLLVLKDITRLDCLASRPLSWLRR